MPSSLRRRPNLPPLRSSLKMRVEHKEWIWSLWDHRREE